MVADAAQLGPLQVRGSLHETIWGGHSLATIAGKELPDGALIGESWETAIDSSIVNAPYAGLSLGEAVERYDVQLLGWRAIEVFGHRFPLLAKFMDAQQWLSVQVHPNDAYAAAREHGKLGKTETWYILSAAPDAQIIYGVARETTAAEVRQAIAETRLEQLLQTVEVQAGDVIFVPAGTVHAIGAGVALYELQEYSDVTYRLYDYGRLQANGQPRELHVERGLDVMHYTPPRASRVTPVAVPGDTPGISRRVLVACEYFVEEELRLQGEMQATTNTSSCVILSVLSGEGRLTAAGSQVMLDLGDTVVLPAALGAYGIVGEHLVLLRSYVPTQDDEGVRLWRAAQPAAGGA